MDQRLGRLIKKQDNNSFLPLLCEINVFLWQDGEDLVQDLVWVGLTGQSNVVLCLAEKKDRNRNVVYNVLCWTENR